jgi:hypothetical protein
MLDLRKKLLVLAMGCLMTVGVQAQGQGDKRPPKDPHNRVVVQPKEQKPPPSNNNQGNKKDDKKEKP